MTSENGPGYLVPVERIEGAILEIRGKRVMLDADLAALYGVPTKRVNEQVRRNVARFPADFMFQLTSDEYAALRSQIAALDVGTNRSQFATGGVERTAYCAKHPSQGQVDATKDAGDE